MPEFIEREGLLKRIKASPLITNYLTMRGSQYLVNGILDLIKKQPATDVSEIIRCKDCKNGFRRQKESSKLNFYWCSKWNNIMRDSDFCSFGERYVDDG